jgi:hypothetical protein
MRYAKAAALTLALLFLPGCEGAEDKLDNLVASTDAAAERRNAALLNEYAAAHNIRYTLEIRDADTDRGVDVSDIEDHISDNLEVTIRLGDGQITRTWNPADNRNIYILLRE